MATVNLRDTLKNVNYQTKSQIDNTEPTGFVNWKDAALSSDAATRTITIAPAGASYKLLSRGLEIIKAGSDSVVFPDVEGMHFVYFNESGSLVDTQDWDDKQFLMSGDMLVAMFYWDATNHEFVGGDIQNECHGLMDGRVHARLHLRDGLVILSGLALNTVNTSEDGTSLASAQWGRDVGDAADEDIIVTIPARASTTSTVVIHLDGNAPNWRNGTPVAGTSIMTAGSGRPAYNKKTGGTYDMEEVPDGYFVVYHSFVTIMNDGAKSEFTVPGQKVYASRPEAVVGQLNEALTLADTSGNAIAFHEYHLIGSVILHCSDSYTNAVKAVVTEIGGGKDWLDYRFKHIGSGQSDGESLIPLVLARKVTANSTLSEADMDISADTTAGSLTLICPTIASLSRTDRSWLIQKITFDENSVFVKLETPTDSAGGTQFRAFRLDTPGKAIRVSITEDKKYTFMVLDTAQHAMAYPKVTTLKPAISGTDLTCRGDIADIASESSVQVKFQYREVGELVWIETANVTKTATGEFQEVITVTAGNNYEVQAILTDLHGYVSTGAVRITFSNYYGDIAAAKADGMVRYWPLQEASGTDTEGAEILYGTDPMVCSGGVTIASQTIATQTIYRRVFGGSDKMDSTFKYDATTEPFTIIIWADVRSTAGDCTLLSTGKNIISVASDGVQLQTEVRGTNETWTPATPTGAIVMMITSNTATTRTKLSTVTGLAVTERTNTNSVIGKIFEFFRIADGALGDGNHQEGEYLNDGDVYTIGFWNRVLSENEAKDIAKALTDNGVQIVA